MAKIFISYRRDDSQYQADRLHAALKRHVANPKRDIFIDVDNIPVGVDFVDHLDAKVSECDVLLALIGPDWLDARNAETGARRLDDPEDFVRIEIASALKRGIPVAPILLDGAPFPPEQLLPDDLKALVRRNGVEVRRASFDADAERMIRGLGLKKLARNSTPSATGADRGGGGWIAGMVALGVLAITAAGAWAWFANPGDWRRTGGDVLAAAPPAINATSEGLGGDAPGAPPPAESAEITEDADAAANEDSNLCGSVVAGRFPFTKTSISDAAPADVFKLFGPNGQIDSFVKRLEPGLDKSGPVWAWRSDSVESALLAPGSAGELQKAAAIRDLLASGLVLNVEATGFGRDITSAELTIGDGTYRFNPSQKQQQIVGWKFSGSPVAGLIMLNGTQKAFDLTNEGPWAIFRLLNASNIKASKPKAIDATFGTGSTSLTLRFTSTNSLLNPFGSDGFWSFKCPSER